MIWRFLVETFAPKRVCRVCGAVEHREAMAQPGSCMACWYSDDDAIQDAAWEALVLPSIRPDQLPRGAS